MATDQVNKILIGGLFIVLAIAALAINFISVRQADLQYAEHTTNAGELVSGVLVGQTVVARENNLSAIGVKFATYSNRANTETVEFHVREGVAAGKDLRTGSVKASDVRDNQFYRFEFAPLPDSRGKTYFFYLASPQSRAGNAITIDLDTRDPYHEGSAYVVRGEAGTEFPPEAIARSGKQTVDVVFATYHTTSLRSATLTTVREFVQTLIATWDERRGSYLLWLELLAPLLAVCAVLLTLRTRIGSLEVLPAKQIVGVLGVLIVAGILWRVLYAVALPVTNDEGNYLYDAAALLRGTLAGGDGYVKAPLVIGWLSLWQLVFGHTILVGRLAMVVVSALTAVPLYFAVTTMAGQRPALLAAAAWSLFGAPAVFGIYVHTQAVALLFGIAGIVCLWAALKREAPGSHWFILTGILLGLGVASRKSILALGLVPLALIVAMSFSARERITRLLTVGIAFACIILIFATGAIVVYGCDSPLFFVGDGARCIGLEETLGINSAEDGLSAVTPEEAENARAYSLRGMTPFFRESLPLIFLATLGWGLVLERAVREGLRRRRAQRGALSLPAWAEGVLPKAVWLMPALSFLWAWSFFVEYEGSVFQDFGAMKWLWYVFAAAAATVALWTPSIAEHEVMPERPTPAALKKPEPTNVAHQALAEAPMISAVPQWQRDWRSLVVLALLPLLWVGGLAFFYMNWIKFHANYIVEFLPPLVIMSGIGAYLAWQRLSSQQLPARAASLVLLGILVWAGYLSNYITYVFPHTGTFDQGSIAEAAAWAAANIPADEPIFTGAAAVPYVSGHRVALDIAHPRWYAYEFTRKDTPRLTAFLPSIEDMLAAYREADWFLLEQQTGFSFLMEYAEIEAGLTTNWQPVHEVENLSNTLTFYRRVK